MSLQGKYTQLSIVVTTWLSNKIGIMEWKSCRRQVNMFEGLYATNQRDQMVIDDRLKSVILQTFINTSSRNVSVFQWCNLNGFDSDENLG